MTPEIDDVIELSSTVTAERGPAGLVTLWRNSGERHGAAITLTRDAEHKLLELLMTRAGIPL